ncbi:hypothetical protein L2E82_26009 [Cichorium intybus]|uniref:Uncharacterized protein n=1 Tax=Cichorium intybus TaxID=13427 RepID=A0ACB9E4R6_CICIN|nr:hypothetical protein L2E82_26009 [Cichorium intybus]
MSVNPTWFNLFLLIKVNNAKLYWMRMGSEAERCGLVSLNQISCCCIFYENALGPKTKISDLVSAFVLISVGKHIEVAAPGCAQFVKAT